jgi:hypothetical protein
MTASGARSGRWCILLHRPRAPGNNDEPYSLGQDDFLRIIIRSVFD